MNESIKTQSNILSKINFWEKRGFTSKGVSSDNFNQFSNRGHIELNSNLMLKLTHTHQNKRESELGDNNATNFRGNLGDEKLNDNPLIKQDRDEPRPMEI